MEGVIVSLAPDRQPGARTKRTVMKKILIFSCVCLGLLLLAPLSHADVIFSNLGPGGTYDPNTGWTIGNPVWAPGAAFSVSGSHTLLNIQVALLHFGLDSGPVTISLYTDIAGAPGTLMEDWTLGGVPDIGSPNGTLLTLNSAGFVLSNATYWLIGSAPPEVWDAWMWNENHTLGTVYLAGSAQQGVVPAFQVNDTVPEPGTLVLFGSGLLGLAGVLRRKLLS